jgi:hypothetical protein
MVQTEIAEEVGPGGSKGWINQKISSQNLLAEVLLDEGFAIVIFVEAIIKVWIECLDDLAVVRKDGRQTAPCTERLVDDPGNASAGRWMGIQAGG